MGKLKLFAYCTIASAVIAIVSLSITFAISGGRIPFDYGIVLDAGTNHTTAILYKWSGDKKMKTGEVIEVHRCSQTPGISSIENARLAGDNVLICTINVTQFISPDEYRKSPVPIFLGATAAMRILSVENPAKSDHIIDAIEKTLSNQLTDFQVKQVDIITGKDEALSAWISTNYIAGNLIQKPTRNDTMTSKTFGILDMKEISAQIAYQVNDNTTSNISTDLAEVRLFGVNRAIHSNENLCGGSKEAAKRYLASLIVKNKTNFDAACLNKDLKYTLSGSAFKTNDHCYQRKDDNISDKEYQFTGIGDATQCEKEIASQLFTDCGNTFHSCPTAEESSPPLNMTFIAMSTYYNTVKLFKGNERMHINHFRSKAVDFCERTMDDALKSENYDTKLLGNFSCFDCFYVLTYLEEIYKFSDEDWNRMRFIKSFHNDNTDLRWTLGFMINATNAISEEAPTPNQPVTAVFIILLVIFIFILSYGFYVSYFDNTGLRYLDDNVK